MAIFSLAREDSLKNKGAGRWRTGKDVMKTEEASSPDLQTLTRGDKVTLGTGTGRISSS